MMHYARLETVRASVLVATTRCSPGLMSSRGGGVPYHVTNPTMHLMLPPPPEQNDRQIPAKILR